MTCRKSVDDGLLKQVIMRNFSPGRHCAQLMRDALTAIEAPRATETADVTGKLTRENRDNAICQTTARTRRYLLFELRVAYVNRLKM